MNIQQISTAHCFMIRTEIAKCSVIGKRKDAFHKSQPTFLAINFRMVCVVSTINGKLSKSFEQRYRFDPANTGMHILSF